MSELDPNVREGALYRQPGHYYSPIPSLADVERALVSAETSGFDRLGNLLDDSQILASWHAMRPHMSAAPFPREQTPEFRYFFENIYFSYGDALVYYGQIASQPPRRIIEIGSGFSSALALDASEFLKLDIDFTFIDPNAGRLKEILKEGDRVRLIERQVQDVSLDLFDTLQAGDILFIDSSHVAKAGSDVLFQIFEILPRLRPGVRIHIHDIFYPFEYPRQWMAIDERAWNEVYFIRAFLMFNDRFRITFFNHYFGQKFNDIASQDDSVKFNLNSGGSLWIEKTS